MIQRFAGKESYKVFLAINSFSTSTLSVVATESMLQNVTSSELPIGATKERQTLTATYIGKDIIGQTAGLVYGFVVGKTADTKRDSYLKKALFMQQSAYFLESCSSSILSLTNSTVLPFFGFTSFLKNVSFIAIGAVNAQTVYRNTEPSKIGETYAKIASINTVASTLGMLLGVYLVKAIPCSTTRTALVVPIFSSISVWSILKSAKEEKVQE